MGTLRQGDLLGKIDEFVGAEQQGLAHLTNEVLLSAALNHPASSFSALEGRRTLTIILRAASLGPVLAS